MSTDGLMLDFDDLSTEYYPHHGYTFKDPNLLIGWLCIYI